MVIDSWSPFGRLPLLVAVFLGNFSAFMTQVPPESLRQIGGWDRGLYPQCMKGTVSKVASFWHLGRFSGHLV